MLVIKINMNAKKTDLRCRCGCLLAKISVPVVVSFDAGVTGIEIRCRRCKADAVVVPAVATAVATAVASDDASDDALRAAE